MQVRHLRSKDGGHLEDMPAAIRGSSSAGVWPRMVWTILWTASETALATGKLSAEVSVAAAMSMQRGAADLLPTALECIMLEAS